MTALTQIPRKLPSADSRQIRVMLVDDSQVARSIFSRLLSGGDGLAVVAEASDSAEALAQLRTIEVDVILLDIEMPKRSGLEALPEIMLAANGARIIVVSSFVQENGPAAIQALSLGACDTLAKPGRTGFGGGFSERLVEKVTRLGRSGRKLCHQDFSRLDPFELSKPECIAIGASTGGIPVIYRLIQSLDPQLDCPIFIVQHLPDAFMDFFARQLTSYTSRNVSVATSGAKVQAGHIYVAPGAAHLVCRRANGKVYLDHVSHYSGSRYCPSVDALFASVAEVYGQGALAIVLSGMGNDGVAGARQLSAKNATILAQDPESSVVWGMPGAIARENLANAILSPAELANLLSTAASR
jgi:two-component system, chemotaxis family, protein-glutamate methylesterase/glutaminase